jgi:hypothetical protein
MCGLCGILGPDEHWTDSDATLKQRTGAETRRRERAHQVALTNRILGHYGLKMADWQGTAFVVSNRTGASEVIDHFAALWPTAEKMAKKTCDPLDPGLIAALRRS